MKTNKFLLIAGLIFCFTSCTTDYVASVELQLINNSSKTIYILNYNNKVQHAIDIGANYTLNTTFESKKDAGNSINPIAVWDGNLLTSFRYNNEVTIAINKTPCNDKSAYKVIRKKKLNGKFSYTFTDADYQYALENGTVLEF